MTDENKNQAAQPGLEALVADVVKLCNLAMEVERSRDEALSTHAAKYANLLQDVISRISDLHAAKAAPDVAQPAALFTRHNKGGSGEFVGVQWNMPLADIPDQGALFFEPAQPASGAHNWIKDMYGFLESTCPEGFADEVFRVAPEAVREAISSVETGESKDAGRAGRTLPEDGRSLSVAPAQPVAAQPAKVFGYALESNDGHITFFKTDPKGFRGDKWKGLAHVHTLYKEPPTLQESKDAQRYRWLRAPDTEVALVLDKRVGWVPPDEMGCGGYHAYEYRAGEELDAAIDAAIAASIPAKGDKP